MTETLEQHLRAALSAVLRVREALPALTYPHREPVQREIASAETSIGRALHLIAGGS